MPKSPKIPELISLEKALIKKRGLSEFIKRAWHVIESGPLLWNWHHDAMCEHLMAVHRGEISNLIINVPPGTMKTLTVNVFFPAWEWTVRHGEKYLSVSYSQTLSDKPAGIFKDLVSSHWYQTRWGDSVKLISESVRMLKTAGGGIRFATTVGGGAGSTATGFHGTRLIFDDLLRAQDAYNIPAVEKANEFWFKTMRSRGASTGAARIGIMQRIHFDDVAARCIESGDYETLVLPMEYVPDRHHVNKWYEDPREKEGQLLWSDRFNQEEVDSLRKDLGAVTYESQYQQNPAPAEGALFNLKWFNTDEIPFLPPNTTRYIQSWDLAFGTSASNDYSVGQVWAENKGQYFLLEQVRGKWDIVERVEQVKRLYAKYPHTTQILIENAASGKDTTTMLKGSIPCIKLITVSRSKVDRAAAICPMLEAKNVFFPIEKKWFQEFLLEAQQFPLGANDDQIDAMSQALNFLRESGVSKILAAYQNL